MLQSELVFIPYNFLLIFIMEFILWLHKMLNAKCSAANWKAESSLMLNKIKKLFNK